MTDLVCHSTCKERLLHVLKEAELVTWGKWQWLEGEWSLLHCKNGLQLVALEILFVDIKSPTSIHKHQHNYNYVSKYSVSEYIASYPGKVGGERASDVHCMYMCIIIIFRPHLFLRVCTRMT